MSSDLLQPITHKLDALKIKQTPRVLLVSIERQELVLLNDDREIRRFQVSTSSNAPSCRANSFGTPTGLHQIAEKIGDGAQAGEVFRGRVSIGQRFDELREQERRPNLITSRILWLQGLEPGHNAGEGVDSYDRYIYIHGTNHEDKIGQPASGGCVQLRNHDMIELFDAVQVGDLVNIA